jgi:hypothetical protein
MEYDSVASTFVEIDISTDTRFTAIKGLLLDFLKEQKYSSGLKISLLVENQQGLGTGYLSIAMSVIAFALYELTGKINKKMLKDYDQFLHSDSFAELLEFSKKLVELPTKGNVYGANNYLVFSNTAQPQVYYKLSEAPLKFMAKTLEDFFAFPEEQRNEQLPFDYGYFFLGSGYTSNMIISMKTNFKTNITDDEQQISMLFKQNGINCGKGDFYQAFQDIFIILKMKLLLAFREVLKYPHNDELFEKFIATINTYHHYSELPQPDDPLVSLIRTKFEQYKYFSDEKLGIFPIASGKTGGSFGFVMKYQKSRETLKKVFEILVKEGNSKIVVPYVSRIDGSSNEGVIREK